MGCVRVTAQSKGTSIEVGYRVIHGMNASGTVEASMSVGVSLLCQPAAGQWDFLECREDGLVATWDQGYIFVKDNNYGI